MQITSWEEADQAGAQVLANEAEIEKLKAEIKKKKLEVDEELGPKVKDYEALNQERVDAIYDWFTAHPEKRDEGKKRVTLSACVIAERETTEISWPRPIGKLLEKLERLGKSYTKFIRVKKEPDKEMLEKAETEELKELGLRKQVFTTVSVKPVGGG